MAYLRNIHDLTGLAFYYKQNKKSWIISLSDLVQVKNLVYKLIGLSLRLGDNFKQRLIILRETGAIRCNIIGWVSKTKSAICKTRDDPQWFKSLARKKERAEKSMYTKCQTYKLRTRNNSTNPTFIISSTSTLFSREKKDLCLFSSF